LITIEHRLDDLKPSPLQWISSFSNVPIRILTMYGNIIDIHGCVNNQHSLFFQFLLCISIYPELKKKGDLVKVRVTEL
jgi:hypothetical protein